MKNKIIKKIALSTMGIGLMAAVPIMSSINTPTTQEAQSGAVGNKENKSMVQGSEQKGKYEFTGATAYNRDYTTWVTSSQLVSMLEYINLPETQGNGGAPLNWLIYYSLSSGWEYGEALSDNMTYYNDWTSFLNRMENSQIAHGTWFDYDDFKAKVKSCIESGQGMKIHFHTEYYFLLNNQYTITATPEDF